MKKQRLYDLSHPFGFGMPVWPGSPDLAIERIAMPQHNGQTTTMLKHSMHLGTHVDAPIHVNEKGCWMDEVPLETYYGTGVVVSIPKDDWELITAEELENADPKIEKGDIVIINTGWHEHWGNNTKYFQFSPGMWKEAADWFVEKEVKCVGHDTQANDIFLCTKGPDRTPWVYDKYKERTGRDLLDDFPQQYDPPEHPSQEYAHNKMLMNGIGLIENVGGDIDAVTGMRLTIAAFPLKYWHGDGSLVRVVAIVDEDAGNDG